ncbi:hypothetical protein ACFLTP_03755 [Chloroflexota bacterium]
MQKTLQSIAFILIGIGILVMIGWSVAAFFMAADIPVWIRIAIGAIGVGVLVLIVIVIKDRFTKAKKEDFKDVEK